MIEIITSSIIILIILVGYILLRREIAALEKEIEALKDESEKTDVRFIEERERTNE